MSAIRKLIEAVEAGEWHQAAAWRVFGIGQTGRAARAFNGSLDAAKALHEAVLPGWWWTVGTCNVSDDARVSPTGPESVHPSGQEWSEITDIDQRPPGNPAKAWLLSILTALEEGAIPGGSQ